MMTRKVAKFTVKNTSWDSPKITLKFRINKISLAFESQKFKIKITPKLVCIPVLKPVIFWSYKVALVLTANSASMRSHLHCNIVLAYLLFVHTRWNVKPDFSGPQISFLWETNLEYADSSQDKTTEDTNWHEKVSVFHIAFHLILHVRTSTSKFSLNQPFVLCWFRQKFQENRYNNRAVRCRRKAGS